MGRLNLNIFFDELANFKIGFTEDPTPVQITNKDLVFKLGSADGVEYDFEEVVFNRGKDQVEIHLK